MKRGLIAALALVCAIACTDKKDPPLRPPAKLELRPGDMREIRPGAPDLPVVVSQAAKVYVVQAKQVVFSAVLEPNAEKLIPFSTIGARSADPFQVVVLGGDDDRPPPPPPSGDGGTRPRFEDECPRGIDKKDCDDLCIKCLGCCPPVIRP